MWPFSWIASSKIAQSCNTCRTIVFVLNLIRHELTLKSMNWTLVEPCIETHNVHRGVFNIPLYITMKNNWTKCWCFQASNSNRWFFLLWNVLDFRMQVWGGVIMVNSLQHSLFQEWKIDNFVFQVYRTCGLKVTSMIKCQNILYGESSLIKPLIPKLGSCYKFFHDNEDPSCCKIWRICWNN
jgi:hypothetical protein